MTQEQCEKLERIAGFLEGITWGIDNEHICEGIDTIIGTIDGMLKEDRKDV